MIYISRIKLHNFKSFDDLEIKFDSGINFLVGDNNCGKTTIFSAIEFILSGKDRDSYIAKDKIAKDDYVSAEITLSGDSLIDYLDTDTVLKRYKKYIFTDGGLQSLIIRRSSKIEKSADGKDLDITKIRIIDKDTGEQHNPTGIDKTIAALFDIQLVLADTKSSDYFDLNKTKLCGKLIKAIVNTSRIEEWKEFENTHKAVFSRIKKQLTTAEKSITKHLKEQYSDDAEASFSFTPPQMSDMLTEGNLLLKESNTETTSVEKGTGMQRALVLAVMQTYSELAVKDNDDKPTFFLLDEPETFLHPNAQYKLLESLNKISKTSQVFITTHSPYLLTKFNPEVNSITVFHKIHKHNTIKRENELNLFGKSSPTWGEINYYAFGIYTETFHDELYGFLQTKAIDIDIKNYREEGFNEFLNEKGIENTKKWIKELSDKKTHQQDRTLPVYIRNYIHHPENTHNARYSSEELKSSIDSLLSIYKRLK